MRLRLEGGDFVVLDDFLPAAQFERVNHYFCAEAPLRPAPRSDRTAWTADDGQPLSAHSIVCEVGKLAAAARGKRPGGPLSPAVTSTDALELVVTGLIAELDRYGRLLGAPPRQWRAVSATAFAYPAATSLEWHSDGTRYTGAYAFYAHGSWEEAWGGELLIQHGRRFDLGTVIAPLPNRLVVLRGGTRHKIARVTALAGEHCRYSVSGLFLRRRTA